jgi:hypothetical protein
MAHEFEMVHFPEGNHRAAGTAEPTLPSAAAGVDGAPHGTSTVPGGAAAVEQESRARGILSNADAMKMMDLKSILVPRPFSGRPEEAAEEGAQSEKGICTISSDAGAHDEYSLAATVRQPKVSTMLTDCLAGRSVLDSSGTATWDGLAHFGAMTVYGSSARASRKKSTVSELAAVGVESGMIKGVGKATAAGTELRPAEVGPSRPLTLEENQRCRKPGG